LKGSNRERIAECIHDWRAPPHQGRQTFFLKNLWNLSDDQQQPMAAFESHLLFVTEAPHFTAPHFFDRFVTVLDDVEPVETGSGPGVRVVSPVWRRPPTYRCR
jgi:hypothetical protein